MRKSGSNPYSSRNDPHEQCLIDTHASQVQSSSIYEKIAAQNQLKELSEEKEQVLHTQILMELHKEMARQLAGRKLSKNKKRLLHQLQRENEATCWNENVSPHVPVLELKEELSDEIKQLGNLLAPKNLRYFPEDHDSRQKLQDKEQAAPPPSQKQRCSLNCLKSSRASKNATEAASPFDECTPTEPGAAMVMEILSISDINEEQRPAKEFSRKVSKLGSKCRKAFSCLGLGQKKDRKGNESRLPHNYPAQRLPTDQADRFSLDDCTDETPFDIDKYQEVGSILIVSASHEQTDDESRQDTELGREESIQPSRTSASFEMLSSFADSEALSEITGYSSYRVDSELSMIGQEDRLFGLTRSRQITADCDFPSVMGRKHLWESLASAKKYKEVALLPQYSAQHCQVQYYVEQCPSVCDRMHC